MQSTLQAPTRSLLSTKKTQTILVEEEVPHTLSSPINQDIVMQEEKEPEGFLSMLKMILSGQYTYLTYLILSSTCFFMWLTPNYNKLRMFFKGQPSQQTVYSGRKNTNSKRRGQKRTMQIRS